MDSLYDRDLVLWAAHQARELRAAADAGWNAPIDWENVAEEIESLGKAERHALASHISIVIEHLLKLQVSPATEPVRGWRDSVRRARREIERLLQESPSLRREVPSIILREMAATRALVLANLQDCGEEPVVDVSGVAYDEGQVLGDWLPERG
jgi:branched-subunit amino acid aminotransferase/4-amino-4-deoxychorismate lyase